MKESPAFQETQRTPGRETRGLGRVRLAFVFLLIFALHHLQNTLKVMYVKHRQPEQFRSGSCGQSFEFKEPDTPMENVSYISCRRRHLTLLLPTHTPSLSLQSENPPLVCSEDGREEVSPPGVKIIWVFCWGPWVVRWCLAWLESPSNSAISIPAPFGSAL